MAFSGPNEYELRFRPENRKGKCELCTWPENKDHITLACQYLAGTTVPENMAMRLEEIPEMVSTVSNPKKITPIIPKHAPIEVTTFNCRSLDFSQLSDLCRWMVMEGATRPNIISTKTNENDAINALVPGQVENEDPSKSNDAKTHHASQDASIEESAALKRAVKRNKNKKTKSKRPTGDGSASAHPPAKPNKVVKPGFKAKLTKRGKRQADNAGSAQGQSEGEGLLSNGKHLVFRPPQSKRDIDVGSMIGIVMDSLEKGGIIPENISPVNPQMWTCAFGSVNDARACVGKKISFDAEEVVLERYLTSGPRVFICDRIGPITNNEAQYLIATADFLAGNSFWFGTHQVRGVGGAKRVLVLETPPEVTTMTFQGPGGYELRFRPENRGGRCEFCVGQKGEDHTTMNCKSLAGTKVPENMPMRLEEKPVVVSTISNLGKVFPIIPEYNPIKIATFNCRSLDFSQLSDLCRWMVMEGATRPNIISTKTNENDAINALVPGQVENEDPSKSNDAKTHHASQDASIEESAALKRAVKRNKNKKTKSKRPTGDGSASAHPPAKPNKVVKPGFKAKLTKRGKRLAAVVDNHQSQMVGEGLLSNGKHLVFRPPPTKKEINEGAMIEIVMDSLEGGVVPESVSPVKAHVWTVCFATIEDARASVGRGIRFEVKHGCTSSLEVYLEKYLTSGPSQGFSSVSDRGRLQTQKRSS
ncbi:hypothetical protein E4U36_008293 [Claviceps purpurea]|nr:hypothetical protein E4U36_008293 [Claviceps purpurea]